LTVLVNWRVAATVFLPQIGWQKHPAAHAAVTVAIASARSAAVN